MESGPTQAVLPLVGLAAEKVIRDRYNTTCPGFSSPTGRCLCDTIAGTRAFRGGFGRQRGGV
ncbi:MAG: hypothetical protein ACQESR_29520 [Planctomycetota bacterium]